MWFCFAAELFICGAILLLTPALKFPLKAVCSWPSLTTTLASFTLSHLSTCTTPCPVFSSVSSPLPTASTNCPLISPVFGCSFSLTPTQATIGPFIFMHFLIRFRAALFDTQQSRLTTGNEMTPIEGLLTSEIGWGLFMPHLIFVWSALASLFLSLYFLGKSR